MIGKGKESTEYRLSLATSGNFVYYIYFDKFYLKKDESIYVDKSDDPFIRPVLTKQSHPNTTIKAFDFIYDGIKNKEVFVFGTNSYVPAQQN